MFRAIVESLRPKQWTKNGVVLAGVIFSHNLTNPSMTAHALAGAVLFCLLSGAVYLINDIQDLEKDRGHPVKGLRPLASGRLTVTQAWVAALGIGGGALALSFAVGSAFGTVAIAYVTLVTLYSFVLKHVVLVDVFTIAMGFVLRAVAGVAAIAHLGPVGSVTPSPWLLVCTFLLATFLALAKRRSELFEAEREGKGADVRRSVLAEYTLPLVDQLTAIVSAATIVAYALYTFDERTVRTFGTRQLAITIPFVMYGIFRYLYLVHRHHTGGSPEIVFLTDRGIFICVIGWLATAAFVIYGPQLLPL